MSSASTLVSTFSPNLSQTFSPGTAYRAEAVARAERDLTASTDRYMRHAAHALALAAVRELRDAVGRVAGAGVILLIGGGHNGGDALLAGAFLAGRGCAVTAALATDHPHPTAMEAAERAGVRVAHEPLEACERAAAGGVALVIDGLTGIGATGPLRSRAAALVAPLRAAGRRGARPFRVVAVDLPSGTGVDDGAVAGPVLAADLSITFTCLKGAHLLPPAAGLCGRVEVADLGLPLPADPDAILVSRPADSELGRLLRVPGDTDHKYTRGVVGLWAGSRAYPGAAVLTASAAVRTGAGMVRLAAPQRVEDLVVAHRPEVVLASGRCQAAVIGPGTDPADIMRGAELDAVLMDLLGQHDDSYSSCSVSPGSRPAVIDAGALLLLAERLRGGVRCAPTHVLTPHAGEAAALLTTLGASISRTEVEAAPGKRSKVILHFADKALAPVFAAHAAYFAALSWAEPLTVLEDGAAKPENAMTAIVAGVEIYLPLKGLIDVEKEKARLTKELANLVGEEKRLGGKLANEGFVKKAPPAVVEKEREKLEVAREKKKAVEERLAYLAKL